MRTLAVALFGLAVHLTAGGAAAQVSELKYDGVRKETPSGLPVPRLGAAGRGEEGAGGRGAGEPLGS